jgi:hypothetical protein
MYPERWFWKDSKTETRFLSFVIYLKQDNAATFESTQWNWSKTPSNDDAVFVASCINTEAANEIRWPKATKRAQLETRVPDFPRCIGFIDGTLHRIYRWNSGVDPKTLGEYFTCELV